MQAQNVDLKEFIRTRALKLGFSFIGFARAEMLSDHEIPLRQWLDSGMNAGMDYMANHFDMRLDPRMLHEGTKTVISLAFNYFPLQSQPRDTYQIAKYAYGQDYHEILKPKLRILLNDIATVKACTGRIFTDSAPILEREWARRAGLGWIGKNSLLITPQQGSFLFLSEILLDVSIEPDVPFDNNYCGTCTRCIDSCPTSAIVHPGIIDARKCLSYCTIEHRGEFTDEHPRRFADQIFGCDICQDVCPWNKKSIPHTEPLLEPHPLLHTLKKKNWELLTEDEYKFVLKKSAIKRTKYEGLMRNINRAACNN